MSTVQVETVVGSVDACPPCFLSASDQVAITQGNIVKVISLSSGIVEGCYEEHKSLVCKVASVDHLTARMRKANPEVSNAVVSLSSDGELRVWDAKSFATLHVLATTSGAVDFHLLVLDDNYDNLWDNVKAFITRRSTGSGCTVHEFDVQKGQLNANVVAAVDHAEYVKFLTVSSHSLAHDKQSKNTANEAKGLAMVSCHRFSKGSKVVFTLLPEHSEGKKKGVALELGEEVTCLAVSHDHSKIAVGTKRGIIEVMSSVDRLFSQYWSSYPLHSQQTEKLLKVLTRSVLHWHAHAVRTLCFSANSDVLMSAGEEAVLVLWHLSRLGSTAQGNSNNNAMRFLPRLGGNITYISVHSSTVVLDSKVQRDVQAEVLLSTKDNAVKVVHSVNLEVLFSFQTLHLPTRPKESFQLSGCVGQEKVVSNYSPGILQFFSLSTHSLISTLKAVHFVKVESGLKSFSPIITHYAFCKGTGKAEKENRMYIVTVDELQGEELDKTSSLKFWLADEVDSEKVNDIAGTNKQLEFQLESQVNSISCEDKVECIAMESFAGEVVVVTGSSAGCCKVYRRSNVIGENKVEKAVYRCVYAVQYRQSIVSSIAISGDLSLFIASYGHMITVWDTKSAVHMCSLLSTTTAHSSTVKKMVVIEPRRSIALGGGNGKVFLVVATDRDLIVYDLLENKKALWQITVDNIKTVSVADSEESVLHFSPDNPANKLSVEGWIAVSYYSKELKKDSFSVYSPLSSTPLYTYTSPLEDSSSILSMALVGGEKLVCCTSEGMLKVWDFDVTAGNKQTIMREGGQVGRVKKTLLPSIKANIVEGDEKEERDIKVGKNVVDKEKRRLRVGNNIEQNIGEYLAENTQDLPRLSLIASDFIRSALRSTDYKWKEDKEERDHSSVNRKKRRIEEVDSNTNDTNNDLFALQKTAAAVISNDKDDHLSHDRLYSVLAGGISAALKGKDLDKEQKEKIEKNDKKDKGKKGTGEDSKDAKLEKKQRKGGNKREDEAVEEKEEEQKATKSSRKSEKGAVDASDGKKGIEDKEVEVIESGAKKSRRGKASA